MKVINMANAVKVESDKAPSTMAKAQLVFEALMSVKGHDDFSMKNGKYLNNSLQVRWSYFKMGWSMREVS